MKTWIRGATAVLGAVLLATTGIATAGAAAPTPAPRAAAAAPLITVQESVYVAITPCRIVDTRLGLGPFANAQTRSFAVVGSAGFSAQGGKSDGCGIPSTATAIAASMTAQVPVHGGYMRFWPADEPEPTATLLNYVKAQNSETGGVITIDAGANPAIKVKNYGGPAGVVIDVTGYFAPQIAVSLDALGGITGGGDGILSVLHPSTGSYLVETDADVTNCLPIVNAANGTGLLGGLLGGTLGNGQVVDAHHIQVNVAQIGVGGLLGLANAPITLTVKC
jgi:hypothetical protein